ncbi:type II secretion system protein GspM [Haliea sp. E17]|uniref:type II secretion system protein GspM n=1 Tax=Haliea sp. E17 TaxID=3401576 RepID=UPI003AADFCDB
MIDWVKTHRRSAAICGIALLVPLLLYLKLLSTAWGWRAQYSDSIDNIEPRLARMRGVLEVQEQLQSLARDARQQRARLVYPATTDRAGVAASLQSELRKLMGDAGLTVADSQVLPVREEERFDYIGIRLTVSGDIASLDQALAQLAQFKPLVMVESLEVWPARQGRRNSDPEAQDATATLRLLSLRSVI